MNLCLIILIRDEVRIDKIDKMSVHIFYIGLCNRNEYISDIYITGHKCFYPLTFDRRTLQLYNFVYILKYPNADHGSNFTNVATGNFGLHHLK
jgi:hypothetical protein